MNRNEKTHSEDTVEINISAIVKSYIGGLIRFWWLVAVLILAGAALMCFKSAVSYSPVYASEATFTVTTNTGNSIEGDDYNFYYDSSTAEQLGLTFPHILSSHLLTDAIKADLGVDTVNGSLSATAVTDSNMVTMRSVSSSPEDAKKVLESAIRVYPDVAKFVIGETRFNMIDPPDLPENPYNKPDYKGDLIKGMAIGLLLGLTLVAVYAFMRKTVHKSDELQVYVNLPCYISLPFVRHKQRKSRKAYFPTIYDKDITQWFTENTEALRLRIEKDLTKSNKKVIMVTSTVPGEGKSVVSANLAYRLAKNGKKVVLIDADLRKQNLAENMGMKATENLEKILNETHEMNTFVNHDKKSNILFIGGNKPFKDTSRFLSKQLKALVDTLRDNVDYIILDVPPAGNFEDALIIKNYADAVLYVVRQDYAPKSRIIETISLLEGENANITGYVFNGVTGVLGTYGYGKYSSYGRYGRYGHYSRYGYYGKYSKYGRYSKYSDKVN